MGRLENVIARHHERRRWNSRKVLLVVIALLVLVVGTLLVFTDVGMPKQPPKGEHRVDDIKLMRAPPSKK